MNKEILKVLVIDKSLKLSELIALFDIYKKKGYNVFVFPLTEEKRETEVILLNYTVADIMKQLFVIEIPYNKDDPFFSFDLQEIGTKEFCEILGQKFEVSSLNLTNAETEKSYV